MFISDIAILNIKGSDYRCITSLISKNDTIKLLQNAEYLKRFPVVKGTINTLMVSCTNQARGCFLVY